MARLEEINVEIKYNKRRYKPFVKINNETAVAVTSYSRHVYKTSHFYFKIDAIKGGRYKDDIIIEHTSKELNRWLEYCGTWAEKYLCPILAYGQCEKGYTWIVQPICRKKAGRPLQKDISKILYVTHKLKITDIAPHSHADQWGYLDGNPVIYDYGL